MNAVIMTQVIIEPAITFVRTLGVDLLNLICQLLILHSSAAALARDPFVVGRTGHMEQFAGRLNGKTLLLMTSLDRLISTPLPHFFQASLLSISSNFFSRAFSISARYSLCLSCSISIWAFSS